MTLTEHYTELLSLAQRYLQQEHVKEEWVFAERQHFLYFKETAQRQQPLKQQTIAVQAAAPVVKPYSAPIPPPAPQPKSVEKTIEPVKAPEPVKPKAVVEEKKAPVVPGYFTPEQLPRTSDVDLSDIRQIVAEKFPQLTIIDEIPQPGVSSHLADVLLITSGEDPTHLEFLQKVAKAIKDRFCAAEVIKYHDNWDAIVSSPHLKLILMAGTELDQLPQLKQYYRELPKHNRQLLGKVPFIPMAEFSAYLTDTKQKSLLWKSVCEHLQT